MCLLHWCARRNAPFGAHYIDNSYRFVSSSSLSAAGRDGTVAVPAATVTTVDARYHCAKRHCAIPYEGKKEKSLECNAAWRAKTLGPYAYYTRIMTHELTNDVRIDSQCSTLIIAASQMCAHVQSNVARAFFAEMCTLVSAADKNKANGKKL